MKKFNSFRLGIGLKIILFTMTMIFVVTAAVSSFSHRFAKNELDKNGRIVLQNAVKMSIKLIEAKNDAVKKGAISLEAAQEEVKVSLLGKRLPDGKREIRKDINLGEYGYLIVYNDNGDEVMHPSLEGKNVLNVEDKSKAKMLLVQDQLAKAKNGGGFSYYKWELPNSKRIDTKITYQEREPNWGWTVIAGSYMMDYNKGADDIWNGIIWIFLVVLIISAVFVFFFSRAINVPINVVINAMKKIEKGDLDISLGKYGENQFKSKWKSFVRKDEIWDLISSMKNMIQGTRERAYAVECLAEGDTSVTVMTMSENDILSKSIIKVTDTIKSMVEDTSMLTKAAHEGDLSKRADASKHKGQFKTIVEGVNSTLDAIIKPLQEVTAVMEEIEKGNLGVSVQTTYTGDYAVLTKAVNNTAVTLQTIIKELSTVLGEIAEGRLDIDQEREYKGDFVHISKSINTIVDALNKIMGDISQASDQVATGASQVAEGSMSLSQGATEQASAIEELSASMTLIADQTKMNAVNAMKANELALEAKERAVQGNERMKDMQKAMEEINDASENISKIIKVIDEIAFQTNILALNAAVEAARAGQHGKGFAVVADEVRNLAARSADAAKETTEYIKSSIKKVEGGTKITNDTADALLAIVESSAKAANLVGDIASASNEQASGIVQINIGIEQVSQVVQTNSATAEESAAASEELMSQGELLNEHIARFVLREEYRMNTKNNTGMLKNTKERLAGNRHNPPKFLELSNESKSSKDRRDFGKY